MQEPSHPVPAVTVPGLMQPSQGYSSVMGLLGAVGSQISYAVDLVLPSLLHSFSSSQATLAVMLNAQSDLQPQVFPLFVALLSALNAGLNV